MIVAYFKATNRCNVGCTHCYIPESVRADKARMSYETVGAAGRFLADMKERSRVCAVTVLWHGGEPLTLPAEFYYKAGAILDEALPGHTEGLQTSLIPLRQEHIPFIQKRCGSHVGSSVDFTQRQINGSVDAYQRLWLTKVELARANGISILPIFVPTRAELGRAKHIVDWFVEHHFQQFKAERYNAYSGHFPDRPSNREHALFLIDLFDALIARFAATGSAPAMSAIQAGITGVTRGMGGDRWGGSCMSNFVVIEPSGSLNNCPDKATVEAGYGSVQAGYQDFALNKFRRKSVRHQQIGHKMSYCLGCENSHFCGSGCPIAPNGVEEDPSEVECSGYKTFLTHVRKAMETPGLRDDVLGYLAHVEGFTNRPMPLPETVVSCAA